MSADDHKNLNPRVRQAFNERDWPTETNFSGRRLPCAYARCARAPGLRGVGLDS